MRRLAAVLAVLVTFGCIGYGPTTTESPGAPKVLLFGDSNMFLAGPSVSATFGPEYTTTVLGIGGARVVDPWHVLMTSNYATGISKVVVQLGTNDGADLALVPAAIDSIMAAVPVGVPVRWNRVMPWTMYLVVMNVLLDQAATRWPALTIADFPGHFLGHPEWISPDGIHLTRPDGVAEYAAWTKAGIG